MPLSDTMYDSDSSTGDNRGTLNALWMPSSTTGSEMTTFEQFKIHPNSVFSEIDMRLKSTLMELGCVRFERIRAINRWIDELICKIRDIVIEEEMRIKSVFLQFQQTFKLEMMESGRKVVESTTDTSSEENDNQNVNDKPGSSSSSTATDDVMKRIETIECAISHMVYELENLKMNWREFIENKIKVMENEIDEEGDKTLLVIFAVGSLIKIYNCLEKRDAEFSF